MEKFELETLLRKYDLYDANTDYLSYVDRTLRKKSAQNIINLLHEERHVTINDVWSAYAYGDTIKFVYIKKRVFAPKKKEFSHKTETEKVSGEGLPSCRFENGKPDPANDERFKTSLSRARSRIFELASCNEFQHFCTFTVNEKYKDRNDLRAIRRDLAQLVRNINRDISDGEKIKYLLIPEQHKKGGWHLHGLMSGLAPFLTEFSTADHIPQKLKKMIKSGTKVYNFERYARKFGFFTATEIRDPNACSVYLTKYITKEMGKTLLEKNQHLFFASQGLKSRETICKYSADPPPFDEWDFENEYVKIKTVTLSEK